MASHFSCLVNLLFLILILTQAPSIHARPASHAAPTAELIAGNEFLKVFFGRDEAQRELHSGESYTNQYASGSAAEQSGRSTSGDNAASERRITRANLHERTAADGSNAHASDRLDSSRGTAARNINYNNHKAENEATAAAATAKGTPEIDATAEDNKQVVKLVTSGSKIVFLEEYDDANDAIVDAVAREIDLKKENVRTQSNKKHSKNEERAQAHAPHAQHKSNPSDEVKVVAVSVSSSSKRGSSRGSGSGYNRENNNRKYKQADMIMPKQGNKFTETHDDVMRQEQQQQYNRQTSQQTASDVKLTLTTTAPPPPPPPPTAPLMTMMMAKTAASSATSTMHGDDFVNRSHKSEFSIEEAEPLTMRPTSQMARAQGTRSLQTPHAVSGRAVKAINAAAQLDDGGSGSGSDSENSASTNIQNVLAVPLLHMSALTRNANNNTSARRNQHSKHINAGGDGAADIDGDMSDTIMLDTSAVPASAEPSTAAATATATATATAIVDVEDHLLPFQTVIYHDTKEGHGPQSRSISYSSLSQNVEDLQKWRHAGILAEAQRNVSESLKPMPRAHNSEPAKFYSVPSKMYSEPAKFYSEPAKIYSEPAKVYGEPEKIYSEPAKVYGQPAKFYSEPSKVYSQPAKVYGEPAKTYWSPSAGVPTATTTTTTTTTTAMPPTKARTTTTTTTTSRPTSTTTVKTPTTTTSVRSGGYMPSRRPAIVSRIAFGEAQSSTVAPIAGQTQQQQQQQQPLNHHTQYQSNARFHPPASAAQNAQHSSYTFSQSQSTQSHSHSNSHSPTQTQPRRVLFNLDKLPYDLLNAPAQSSQHLLDPDFSHTPPAAVTYSSPRQRQCLESAFSQQQRQHSSLSSDRHSNQNAKGLPNRDLVKCVSTYQQPTTATSTDSGGRNGNDDDNNNNNNNDDLAYKTTPEQNYEIEESVSVMTNGRVHGVQGNTPTTNKPFAMRTTNYRSRGGIRHEQQHPNYNNYDDNVTNDDGDASGLNDGGVGEEGSKSEQDDGGGDEDAKVAYVVEGRNYRKYRVEEKTDDGFIVGEYGVVDHNDGNLRGVRYTADSTINRSLIQKALLTFLKLK